MVFDRWRQCAPHLIHASLDPSKFKFKAVYGSVQLLLHSSRQRLTIPYIGPFIFPLKMVPSHGGIWTPSNTWFRRPILAHNPNGISTGVQPFLHSSPQSVPILYSGPPFPLKIAPSNGGSGHSSNTWFLRPTQVLNPNSILIGSTVFAGLSTDTDRPCYLVWNKRIIYVIVLRKNCDAA